MSRGLSKRQRQVIKLAVIRDSLANERGFPKPSEISIARMEREYAETVGEIIGDLLRAHDRDRDRALRICHPKQVTEGNKHLA